ncbi:MAG: type III-B CRISPR module-associated Cmr3 family protein [Isosphaerales bacterium]
MSVTTLQLTAHDPIIARDGRPFGIGQGNRMRGLGWPLPSVVAGSFRTALVKADAGLDFTRNTPLDLLRVEVAGVFPTVGEELYLPAPSDAVAEAAVDGKGIGIVHRVAPQSNEDGCDFPDDLSLRPVMLSDAQTATDFKPAGVPSWWPHGQMARWLVGESITFDRSFLNSALQETRDHVCLDPDTGAAAEGQIFATAGLNVTHLPRHGFKSNDTKLPLGDRFAEITLSARVTIAERAFEHVEKLSTWHPLGGERRLVHWQKSDAANLWKCPETVKSALQAASRIRMVLAAPAIFENGWRPSWLNKTTLIGKPLGDGPTLKLVGVCISRWRAVSGWAYAPHAEDDGRRRVVPRDRPGPKAVRRMVPAGGVYFFEKVDGDPRILATSGWLRPVSDTPHDCRDGFGLAVWGTW